MMHLSDTDFADQFAQCTLDPKLFTHEGHLRLAWILVTQGGVQNALESIRPQIAAYDRAFGDGTKYHETVTVAAVYVIDHFIRKSHASTFADFISEFPRLRTHFKDILAQHYSIDIFKEPQAKVYYIPPDIQPFAE